MTQVTISQQTAATALVIANVAELVAAIVYRTVGNDLSSSIGGQNLTREAVHSLATAKLRDVIVKDLKK